MHLLQPYSRGLAFGAAAVCATWAAAWDAKLKAEQWLRPDEACDRSFALMLKRIFMRNDALSGHDHDVFFDGPCPVFRLSSFGQGLCVAEASRASLVPSLQLAFDEQQSFASVSQSSIISFGIRATRYVTAGPHIHINELGLGGVATRHWWPILASIEENAAYYLSRQSSLSLTLVCVELRFPPVFNWVNLWPGSVCGTKLLFDQPRVPVGMALCGNCLAIGFNPCFDEDDEETIFAGPCVNVYDSSTFELLNSFEPFTSLAGYKLKALASHSGCLYVGADRQEHVGVLHVLSLQGRLIREYSFEGRLIDISISHGRLYSLSEIPAGVELSVHDLSSTTKLDSYPRSLYFLDTEEHLGAHLRLACTATHVIVYFGGELNDGNLADPRVWRAATVRTFRVLGTELVPLSQLQEEGGETAAEEEADGELFQRLVDAVPSASSLADLARPARPPRRVSGGSRPARRRRVHATSPRHRELARRRRAAPPRVRRLPGGAGRERAHASPRSRAGQRRSTSRAVLYARHKSGSHASPCPTPSRPATLR